MSLFEIRICRKIKLTYFVFVKNISDTTGTMYEKRFKYVDSDIYITYLTYVVK